MNDDEIRALVRVAIQKHLGSTSADEGRAPLYGVPDPQAPEQPPLISISFARYGLPRAEDDTMCLIEPAVRCNHCGYCECHGH